MSFAILTFLSALSLAAVAGWFSIIGFMTIYAGAPMYALIMGAVTEVAKLVTTSWLYRNWEYSSWKLKVPLLYFTLALMTVTSIGVFGFLSKAHIEQGAGKIDNSAKIENLLYQIEREKSIIQDNEKVIAQLDATVNSFLEKDRADRALSVRRSQAVQREELRKDSASAQKRIDELSAEKFKYESEVRKLELEVGPIRYIAELIYGVEENSAKSIESAVRIFTLLIVSSLDPLAVILLIAANHTLLRIKHEKEEKKNKSETAGTISTKVKESLHDKKESSKENLQSIEIHEECEKDLTGIKERDLYKTETKILDQVLQTSDKHINEKKTSSEENKDVQDIKILQEKTITEEINQEGKIRENKNKIDSGKAEIQKVSLDDDINIKDILDNLHSIKNQLPLPTIRSPEVTRVNQMDNKDLDKNNPDIIPESFLDLKKTVPWAQQETVLRELLGNDTPQFIPKKINDLTITEYNTKKHNHENSNADILYNPGPKKDKYHRVLSWLSEFKGPNNERREY